MSKMTPENQEKRDKKWASIVVGRKTYEVLKKKAVSCGIPMHRLVLAYVTMAKDLTDIDIIKADYDLRHSDKVEDQYEH